MVGGLQVGEEGLGDHFGEGLCEGEGFGAVGVLFEGCDGVGDYGVGEEMLVGVSVCIDLLL